MPWLALNVDGTSGILNDLPHDRKPQPRPAIGRLGGEERLEDSFELRGRDTTARILHRATGLVRFKIGFHRHPEARGAVIDFPQGICGVAEEVQEHLFELVPCHPNSNRFLRDLEIQFHALEEPRLLQHF